MLSLRAHLTIMLGVFATVVALVTIGDALTASGAVPETREARLASIAVFFTLGIALAFSAVPVMVKLALGFHPGFGNTQNPATAALIAHERAIVFSLWGMTALGLAVALPAAIAGGVFD